jgi:hypothetical protein
VAVTRSLRESGETKEKKPVKAGNGLKKVRGMGRVYRAG